MIIEEGEMLTPKPVQVSKPLTMNFPEAMRKILNGEKVERVSWGGSDYCLLKDGWLTIFTKGEFHTWSINDGDMEGNDWVVKE